MPYRPRSQHKPLRKADSYLFRLKGNEKLFFKNTIEVDFTPVKALNLEERTK